MTLLSDILPEPEDGTTVVLTGREVYGPLVVCRDDARARRLGFVGLDRWFGFDARPHIEPVSWDQCARFATTAYTLGPVLASLEADHG